MIPHRHLPIRAPIAIHRWAQGHDSKGIGMTEQEERRAREREEIAMRIANFKATQEKFKREREEYFVTTLANARGGSLAAPSKSQRPPFWT
jgi:hypothetical protein